MEGLSLSLSLSLGRRGIGWAVVITSALLLVMVPQVSSIRYVVGSNMGWSPNANYTIWTQDKHFYKGDWLFFVYDRNQMNVLEVNKTDFKSCNSDHPIHNWTTGAGRDVLPLNVTKTYYFISGKGFCYKGMKVAVHVENPPPPPTSLPQNSDSPSPLPAPPTSLPQNNDSPSPLPPPPTSLQQNSDSPSLRSPPPTSLPQNNDSPSLLSTFTGQICVPTLFAAAAIWDAFIAHFQ